MIQPVIILHGLNTTLQPGAGHPVQRIGENFLRTPRANRMESFHGGRIATIAASRDPFRLIAKPSELPFQDLPVLRFYVGFVRHMERVAGAW
jgi:hypothetical protein